MPVMIDMEMPKSCGVCSCLDEECGRCKASLHVMGSVQWVDNWFGDRPRWCPLVELQQYGHKLGLPRYIDKEKLRNIIE